MSVDPLDFAATIDERFAENGQEHGRQYGYQRGFRQGFSRGLDYALENHQEIAVIAAHCEQMSAEQEKDQRQKRLLNSIVESCREFRTALPDQRRYAELLSSIRARYQHVTGTTTTTNATAKEKLTF